MDWTYKWKNLARKMLFLFNCVLNVQVTVRAAEEQAEIKCVLYWYCHSAHVGVAPCILTLEGWGKD